jgi:hypothetical protein
MPGLVPGIHDFIATCEEDVDGRVKPGHDDGGNQASLFTDFEVLGGTYLLTGIA